MLGGEATPPALWRRIAASGVAARNMYGPTEAAVDSTYAPIDDGEPTIGHPLAGTRVYLLDNALQPVPQGARGELYLAGPHLARGYLGQPGITAERFVADPFGGFGERMYRTGDLARWVPGRGVEYLGRSDRQVKIRGHRVEIGEVEAELGALPGVSAAAAVVRSDGGPTRLVGYVVPATSRPGADEATISPDSVRAALAERLPDHAGAGGGGAPGRPAAHGQRQAGPRRATRASHDAQRPSGEHGPGTPALLRRRGGPRRRTGRRRGRLLRPRR